MREEGVYLSTRAWGACARSQSICVEQSGKYGLSSKEKLVRKEGSMPTVGREARRKEGPSPIVALRVSFRTEREQNLRRCQAPVLRHRICTLHELSKVFHIPVPEKIHRGPRSGLEPTHGQCIHCHHGRPRKVNPRQDDNGTIVAKGPNDEDVPLRLGTGQKCEHYLREAEEPVLEQALREGRSLRQQGGGSATSRCSPGKSAHSHTRPLIMGTLLRAGRVSAEDAGREGSPTKGGQL